MREKTIWVTSGYGSRRRQPYVQIAWPGGEMLQLDPPEARDLALNLLRAAEAAEQDALIFEWTKANIPGATNHHAAQLLGEMRKAREKRAGGDTT